MSRKAALDLLYKTLDATTSSKHNSDIWRKRLSKLTDKQIRKVIVDWTTGKDKLHIYSPNSGPVDINVDRCLKLADSLGITYFERIRVPATSTDPAYVTNVPHLITDIPVRRQSQSLAKKVSVTSDDSQVDLLTQQARGDSDTAALTYPELQLLAQTGLSRTATGFIKARGGDRGMYAAMTAQLEATGSTDIATIEKYSTGVQSIKTAKMYLAAILVGTNL